MSGDRLAGPGRSFEPDELRRLVQDFAALRQRVDDMGSQILRSAGLRAEPDLLRVLGSLVVEGDLSVPNGSINNDALLNPVSSDGGADQVLDFTIGVGGAWVTVASVTLDRPSWATDAVVTAMGNLSLATNSSTATPSMRLQIGGTSTLDYTLPASRPTTTTFFVGALGFTRTILGVGSTVVCNLQTFVSAPADWLTGGAYRRADLSATATFTR